jgi:hypothetical protein
MSQTGSTGFFTTIWDTVKTDAEAVWDTDIKPVVSNLVSTGEADIEAVFTTGIPLAIKAVAAQASLVLSGQEKFDAAVVSVAQQLEVALGPVVMADVQALVQIVFRGLTVIANVV